jgi:CRISPR-associated protein Cmr6
MSTRRDQLKDIKLSDTLNAHAGLWLDKYITEQRQEDPTSRSALIAGVSTLSSPELYKAFYQRWEQMLTDQGAQTRKASVKGRMIIGLGDESVLETSITLHKTYGIPYIPGSALKGLAASYARQRLGEAWQNNGEAYKTVFGDTDDTGYITFFDALYIPETGFRGNALYSDVITVHHPLYYQGTNTAPADWDSPNPVPFLSATGNYLAALAGPELEQERSWVKTTFSILRHALAEMGIGAKTSSGYGRMDLEQDPVDPNLRKAESHKREIEQMPTKDVANQIHSYYQKWRDLSSDEARIIVARAIIEKVRQAGREKQTAEKAWYKELRAFLDAHQP